MSKDQTPEPEKINPSPTDRQQQEKNTKQEEQNASVQDNEDDLISKEGYLPEIYFSLKSDNPADW